ncbi:MAG: transcriptional repressor [Flavobacteriaceae bacterium]|nr:transcriptional repressor [Flavobacteriaceae bacterium]
MNLLLNEIKQKLLEKGLKVTPQRLAILQALMTHKNHPTAEMIIEYIRYNHPNIATGTVYKILEVLVEKELIRKVQTEKDIMRYDAIMDKHHHLYCSESERIEDYVDSELDELLEAYFIKKGIPDFKIEDIRLHLNGKFLNLE